MTIDESTALVLVFASLNLGAMVLVGYLFNMSRHLTAVVIKHGESIDTLVRLSELHQQRLDARDARR